MVALFFQQQRAIEQQPEFQGTAEQATQQFQVAHLGQALPAFAFQLLPVLAAGRWQLFQPGQVTAVVLEALLQPGAR